MKTSHTTQKRKERKYDKIKTAKNPWWWRIMRKTAKPNREKMRKKRTEMNVLYLNLCKWLRNTNTHKEIIACWSCIIRILSPKIMLAYNLLTNYKSQAWGREHEEAHGEYKLYLILSVDESSTANNQLKYLYIVTFRPSSYHVYNKNWKTFHLKVCLSRVLFLRKKNELYSGLSSVQYKSIKYSTANR